MDRKPPDDDFLDDRLREDPLYQVLRRTQSVWEVLGDRLEDMMLGLAGRSQYLRRHRCETELQAREVRITQKSDGTAVVAIDDWPPFRVSETLAALIRILAADTSDGKSGRDADPLVPIKSYAEVRALMERTLRRQYSQRAVSQAVYRLREILRARGLGGLLSIDRQRRGYRLAVRRKALPPGGSRT